MSLDKRGVPFCEEIEEEKRTLCLTHVLECFLELLIDRSGNHAHLFGGLLLVQPRNRIEIALGLSTVEIVSVENPIYIHRYNYLSGPGWLTALESHECLIL